MDRKINQAGLDLIKYFEGLRLKAYQDGAGVWTIGYGHTGPEVKSGLVIDQPKANELLSSDIQWAEKAVNQLVTNQDINDNQFSALVSFCYNLGSGNLKQSSLLVAVNNGDWNDAADGFLKWIYIKGKQSSGLLARREKERELFLS